MTGIALKLLVHHHFFYESKPHQHVNDEAYKYLVSENLLEELGSRCGYKITERGECHFQALVAAKLPTSSWSSMIPKETDK